jgi:quercetin dioxygenase-like cupin family protein
MTLDRFPTAADLKPVEGEVLSAELALTDDTLVKAFALGPGAVLDPHQHAGSTNVFHVMEGTLTVIQDDTEERVEAPGVVLHERGAEHGGRNDTEDTVIFTATFAPRP